MTRNVDKVSVKVRASTYVTIFLSRKYWSFFDPITLRKTTSSFSICTKKKCVEIMSYHKYTLYNGVSLPEVNLEEVATSP